MEGTEPLVAANVKDAASKDNTQETGTGKRSRASASARKNSVDQMNNTEATPRKKVDVTLQSLLEAGAHFGHQTARWSPTMAP